MALRGAICLLRVVAGGSSERFVGVELGRLARLHKRGSLVRSHCRPGRSSRRHMRRVCIGSLRAREFRPIWNSRGRVTSLSARQVLGRRQRSLSGRRPSFRLHAAQIEGPFFVLLAHHGADKAGDGRAVGEDVHTTTFVLRLMWALSRSNGLLL